eukprot:TRINITY_DN6200_c0_g1_i1.p1 TRINITY_DN6200_c0_g1~~TRINITY_DN6200_c0_g1_i1.p1  ORF type:complete len:303 (+),score=45.08 TRINITY_DN6200_c0_g1_i1:132-911(+)
MAAAYEIFEACKGNKLARVKELLDAGADPNMTDFDTASTPLHYACTNGSKQCIELLLERGATINCSNDKGTTPLHTLVVKRYDALALLLIKKGANLYQPDRRGNTPKDMALGFLQKELEECWNNRTQPEQETKAPTKEPERTQQVIREDNLKIFLSGGSSGAYKTVKINSNTLAGPILSMMAEKLGMPQFVSWLDLMEIKKESQRKIGKDENLMEIRSRWPLVFGETGNETHITYHFLVRLRPGAPDEAARLYQVALRG